MKPLENKYFVAVLEPDTAALAKLIAKIFVCLMYRLESTAADRGRVTSTMIDL